MRIKTFSTMFIAFHGLVFLAYGERHGQIEWGNATWVDEKITTQPTTDQAAGYMVGPGALNGKKIKTKKSNATNTTNVQPTKTAARDLASATPTGPETQKVTVTKLKEGTEKSKAVKYQDINNKRDDGARVEYYKMILDKNGNPKRGAHIPNPKSAIIGEPIIAATLTGQDVPGKFVGKTMVAPLASDATYSGTEVSLAAARGGTGLTGVGGFKPDKPTPLSVLYKKEPVPGSRIVPYYASKEPGSATLDRVYETWLVDGNKVVGGGGGGGGGDDPNAGQSVGQGGQLGGK